VAQYKIRYTESEVPFTCIRYQDFFFFRTEIFYTVRSPVQIYTDENDGKRTENGEFLKTLFKVEILETEIYRLRADSKKRGIFKRFSLHN